MIESLRAEVVRPRKSGWLLLLAPFALPLAALATCERTEKVTVFVPSTSPHEPIEDHDAAADVEEMPLYSSSSELELVFRAGNRSYVNLGEGDDLARGKPALFENESAQQAVAAVDLKKLSEAQRAWIGRKVIVDNDCVATVVALKVVSRLSAGSLDYVDDGGRPRDSRSEAESVMTYGTQILAGQLDRCDGTYARSADLPMVVVPETRPDDAELVKKAKRELLRSAPALETTRVWTQDFQSQDDWKTQAQYDIRTLRHPITHQTWISIHAWNESGCGDPGVNIWGLFEVKADGSLKTTQLRDLGDMLTIGQIIDIEGDGELELIGRPWLGLDVMVTRDSGDELSRLPLPFEGCPC